MKLALLACALLLLPLARAEATNVHVGLDAQGRYVVAFNLADGEAPPRVAWTGDGGAGGEVQPERQPSPSRDADATWWATLPHEATGYALGNESFALAERPDEEARIAFVADWGRSDDSWAILAQMRETRPDLVLVGGDVSYANGAPEKWDAWAAGVQPLVSRVPLVPAFGNHEALCDRGNGEYAWCAHEVDEYAEHFPTPGEGTRYYAFDWGPARVIVLDSEAYHEHDDVTLPRATDPEAQRAFLDRELDAAGAQGRWRIVVFHRTIYSSNARGEDASDEKGRAELEPVLQGRADLVLMGHVHAYERTRPIDGVTYVTSGGGGRSLYDGWDPQPRWSAERSAEFEFVSLVVTKDRIEGKAIRPDGSALDAFTVTHASRAAALVGKVRDAPGPGLVLLVAVVTISARLSRRRARG